MTNRLLFFIRQQSRHIEIWLWRTLVLVGDAWLRHPSCVLAMSLVATLGMILFSVLSKAFYDPSSSVYSDERALSAIWISLAVVVLYGYMVLCMFPALCSRKIPRTIKVFFILLTLVPAVGPWAVALCLDDER